MLFKIFLSSILLILSTLSFGQSNDSIQNDQGLNDQFQALFDKAETYNDYKVMRITSLNSLWASVEDSIKESRSKISSLNSEVRTLNTKIDNLAQTISKLESDLQKSRKEADSVSFMGIQIMEDTYSILVWSIIVGLLILIGIGYLSHSRNRNLYVRTRRDFEEVNQEFENYRKQSQENKVKLGRELQTERNKVSELQSRLGTRDM